MSKQKNRTFWVLANWLQGVGLSGGDRIFIELVKRFALKINVALLISRDGYEICKREGLENISHFIWVSEKFNKLGYVVNYLYRTIVSIHKALFLRLSDKDVVYSSSDFWPDSLPALILKLKKKDIVWIAGFYLFAANPLDKNSPYNKEKKYLLGFLYWLSQQLPLFLVRKFADFVLVTSEPDVKRFITKKRNRDKILVIQGGVDLEASNKFILSNTTIPLEERKYDACFIGRFHYQKGILELVEIWAKVCQKRPESKLAIIGLGILESKIKEKIKNLDLGNNIDMLGFKNGDEKYQIICQSKIIVHPATYDSGGMAAAEAMAFGLPGVSFDLEALKTYYPKGMAKVPFGDEQTFASEIIRLLTDRRYYEKMSTEARDLIFHEWGWERRAEQVYSSIVRT